MSVSVEEKINVVALYKFTHLPDFASLKTGLLDRMKKNGIKGTLLLAHEGINGTISGRFKPMQQFMSYLTSLPGLDNIVTKTSYANHHPFLRTKVKLKKEIVTLGINDLDPKEEAGEYISPEKWNALLQDEDTVVIDTRNSYEVAIGTFKNAINPNTENFREFPEYSEKHIVPNIPKDKKIAMFCTGGIRCEKSTAFMKRQGYKNVYHLEGGILNYLAKVPKEESLWEGSCFVFDERVAVNHDLEYGEYDQCHGCRYPITAQDKESEHYIPGVQCPNCYNKVSEAHLARAKERQKQIDLAKARNQRHLGGD